MAHSKSNGSGKKSTIKALELSMKEELLASRVYVERSVGAEQLGDQISADLWMHIAEEEEHHYVEFRNRLEFLKASEMSSEHKDVAGNGHTIGPSDKDSLSRQSKYGMGWMGHRKMPSTDNEWEDLAFDIEAKMKSDQERLEVQRMRHLAVEGSNVAKAEARRWLAAKAHELGID